MSAVILYNHKEVRNTTEHILASECQEQKPHEDNELTTSHQKNVSKYPPYKQKGVPHKQFNPLWDI